MFWCVCVKTVKMCFHKFMWISLTLTIEKDISRVSLLHAKETPNGSPRQ